MGLFKDIIISDKISFKIYDSILNPDGDKTNANDPVDNFGATYLSTELEKLILRTIKNKNSKFETGVGQYMRMIFESKFYDNNTIITKIIFYKEDFKQLESEIGMYILKWIILDTFNHIYKKVFNDYKKEITSEMTIDNEIFKSPTLDSEGRFIDPNLKSNPLVFTIKWEELASTKEGYV